MKRDLCESAKRGRVCIDSLCRASDETLCGFNLSEYQEMCAEERDEGCYECGGEGFIVADCIEDTCCCLDPETEHGLIPCPVCTPRTGGK